MLALASPIIAGESETGNRWLDLLYKLSSSVTHMATGLVGYAVSKVTTPKSVSVDAFEIQSRELDDEKRRSQRLEMKVESMSAALLRAEKRYQVPLDVLLEMTGTHNIAAMRQSSTDPDDSDTIEVGEMIEEIRRCSSSGSSCD
jgi:hypothetical protein